MKKSQKTLVLILCVALSMSALWGCGETVEEETVEDVAVVEAANPEVGSLTLSANFIATISPDESVYVMPKTTAEVLEVLVEAGDVVEEGDVLAVLDDTMAQISMKSAQIQLDNAQRSYNLSYGEGATTLNDMQTDNTLTQVEDGVTDLQESLVDTMDALQKTKDQLKEKENELADLKVKYGFREDVDEIKDYADTLEPDADDMPAAPVKPELPYTPYSKTDPLWINYEKQLAEYYKNLADYADEAADYQEDANLYADAMERYQNAATEVAPVEAAIAQYKQAIDQYEEAIETLQDNIDSTYNSYSQTVVSTDIQNGEMRDEQKALSKNTIASAELNIEQAQESLDAYTITATISGVIETVGVDVHDYATSSNPAFVISNKDAMVATYYVSEDVRNTFEIGQAITLEKDGRVYDGEVIEIGTTVDSNTGLFKIKARVKGDTSALLSGTKATVTTDTYHEKNAVIIPYDSVYYDGTQAYVYTVVDGKAHRTEITTGLYDTEKIVVTEGLSKDDLLITTWAAQLREGVDVSIKDSADSASGAQE